MVFDSGGNAVPNIKEIYPVPETRVATQSSRVAQTVFEGGSFILRRPILLNRLLTFVTVVVGGATMKFLVYQAPGGESGIANLKATVAGFAVAAGVENVLTPAEGNVLLERGIVYVLWGRDSGAGTSFSLRTYLTSAFDLLDQNVDTDTHPLIFDTTISTATTPATIDPRASPTGVLVPESVNDVTPVWRVKRV